MEEILRGQRTIRKEKSKLSLRYVQIYINLILKTLPLLGYFIIDDIIHIENHLTKLFKNEAQWLRTSH